MTGGRDDRGEMPRFRFDDRTIDRLLDGATSPEDAPPGAERVARLVEAARTRTTPTPGDLARESQVVTALAAAVRPPTHRATRPGRTPMLAKLLTAKVAAAAAAGLLTATAAAAATNSLPDPAQSALAGAASHVGLRLPNPASDQHGKPTAHTPGNGRATGPDAAGSAKFGLCQAWSAGPSTTNPHDGKSASVAFQNLAKAAADAGKTIADYCKDASPGRSATTGRPANAGNPDASSNAGTPPPSAGRSAGHAQVTTPNGGGTATADTASDSHSATGTATAGAASGGTSGNGSTNAGAHRP